MYQEQEAKFQFDLLKKVVNENQEFIHKAKWENWLFNMNFLEKEVRYLEEDFLKDWNNKAAKKALHTVQVKDFPELGKTLIDGTTCSVKDFKQFYESFKDNLWTPFAKSKDPEITYKDKQEFIKILREKREEYPYLINGLDKYEEYCGLLCPDV